MSTNGAYSPSSWPSDITRLCEHLAAQRLLQGADHPVAAAVAIAARGQQGLTQAEFANQHHVELRAVESLEAGEVPWTDLPDIIGDILADAPPVDLLALADLDAELRRRGTSDADC